MNKINRCEADRSCADSNFIGFASIVGWGSWSLENATIESKGDLYAEFHGYRSGYNATVICNTGDQCHIVTFILLTLHYACKFDSFSFLHCVLRNVGEALAQELKLFAMVHVTRNMLQIIIRTFPLSILIWLILVKLL